MSKAGKLVFRTRYISPAKKAVVALPQESAAPPHWKHQRRRMSIRYAGCLHYVSIWKPKLSYCMLQPNET